MQIRPTGRSRVFIRRPWICISNLGDGGSLRERFEHALRSAVRRLPPGTRLPPTRALATELGVSRGVVVEAYAQLAAEGYLLTRRGGGTFVAHTTPAPRRSRPPSAPPRARRATTCAPRCPRSTAPSARPGRRALDRALRTTPDARLGYPDPRGEPELRAALAESLARRRGVQATADDVRVTGGLGPSLPFVWRLLRDRGVRRVAIEDPCWPRLPATLERAGLEPVPLTVDEHGIRVDALATVDAVFVTPAHQYPSGAVLSPERRAALIDWARSTNAIVLEDDYDAEFRYDRQPVGSLQGLAPDVVIYGGSTSKTLAPGLRLGWLVLPPRLRPTRRARRRCSTSSRSPTCSSAATSTATCAATAASTSDAEKPCSTRSRPSSPTSRSRAPRPVSMPSCTSPTRTRSPTAARAHGVALEAMGGKLIVGYANLPESQAKAAVQALSHARALY